MILVEGGRIMKFLIELESIQNEIRRSEILIRGFELFFFRQRNFLQPLRYNCLTGTEYLQVRRYYRLSCLIPNLSGKSKTEILSSTPN